MTGTKSRRIQNRNSLILRGSKEVLTLKTKTPGNMEEKQTTKHFFLRGSNN